MPYHSYVPSFGEWGYILAMNEMPAALFSSFPNGLRFLNLQTLPHMFIFPDDMKTKSPLEINRLNNQVLVDYFEEEWDNYLGE